MKYCKHILFLLLVLYSLNRLQANNRVYIIDKSLRCQPASNYLTLVSNKNDTIIYKLKIKNITAINQELLLEIPIQQIEKIHVFQLNKNQLIENYNFISKKISQRIYYDRNVIFPINIKAKEINEIYFKYHIDDIHNFSDLNILVWKKDAKITRTEALELTRGVFYGILILYAFVGFVLTVLLNVRNYYYYLFYLVAGGIYLFVKNNLGYEMFWPDYPSIDLFFKKIMLSIYLITSILFLRGFIGDRIKSIKLQITLKYFVYIGAFFVFVSLIAGLLSTPAQNVFIVVQQVFTVVCFITVVLTLIFVYFNTNEKSVVLFTFIFFLSFSFFLFYPQPEFGSGFFGVYFGQIYTYSNAFFIATIFCIFTIYRIKSIMKNNETLKKEVSEINAFYNFSLIEGQQNERLRVGRELHDGVGIMMSAIKMKMSAMQVQDEKEKQRLRYLTHEVDNICDKIRALSHRLLPPTLKKFGLQVALKDVMEDYKIHHQNFTYNFNIPNNLSAVSQQIILDFSENLLDYFSEINPMQLTMSVYVIPSIKEAQIRIQYTGTSLDVNHQYIKSVTSVNDLINGKFTITMLNTWNFKVQMEFPILLQ